jgi:uncharacterized membrane protein
MVYIVAHIAVLVVFGAIDATWLTVMGPVVYRPVLAEILEPSLRVAPAIAFYLIYPIGVVVFTVLPGLRALSRVLDAARPRRDRPPAGQPPAVFAQPLQRREIP